MPRGRMQVMADRELIAESVEGGATDGYGN